MKYVCWKYQVSGYVSHITNLAIVVSEGLLEIQTDEINLTKQSN